MQSYLWWLVSLLLVLQACVRSAHGESSASLLHGIHAAMATGQLQPNHVYVQSLQSDPGVNPQLESFPLSGFPLAPSFRAHPDATAVLLLQLKDTRWSRRWFRRPDRFRLFRETSSPTEENVSHHSDLLATVRFRHARVFTNFYKLRTFLREVAEAREAEDLRKGRVHVALYRLRGSALESFLEQSDLRRDFAPLSLRSGRMELRIAYVSFACASTMLRSRGARPVWSRRWRTRKTVPMFVKEDWPISIRIDARISPSSWAFRRQAASLQMGPIWRRSSLFPRLPPPLPATTTTTTMVASPPTHSTPAIAELSPPSIPGASLEERPFTPPDQIMPRIPLGPFQFPQTPPRMRPLPRGAPMTPERPQERVRRSPAKIYSSDQSLQRDLDEYSKLIGPSPSCISQQTPRQKCWRTASPQTRDTIVRGGTPEGSRAGEGYQSVQQQQLDFVAKEEAGQSFPALPQNFLKPELRGESVNLEHLLGPKPSMIQPFGFYTPYEFPSSRGTAVGVGAGDRKTAAAPPPQGPNTPHTNEPLWEWLPPQKPLAAPPPTFRSHSVHQRRGAEEEAVALQQEDACAYLRHMKPACSTLQDGIPAASRSYGWTQEDFEGVENLQEMRLDGEESVGSVPDEWLGMDEDAEAEAQEDVSSARVPPSLQGVPREEDHQAAVQAMIPMPTSARAESSTSMFSSESTRTLDGHRVKSSDMELWTAVLTGDATEVDDLLQLGGANVDAKDAQGNTLLQIAVDRSYWDVVRVLLEAGARSHDDEEHISIPTAH